MVRCLSEKNQSGSLELFFFLSLSSPFLPLSLSLSFSLFLSLSLSLSDQRLYFNPPGIYYKFTFNINNNKRDNLLVLI